MSAWPTRRCCNTALKLAAQVNETGEHGEQLRCPCHSTSFSPNGQVLAYQLSIAPKPLLQLQVREVNGAIEVFAPTEPTEPT
jgi:Rieske Fe-S protein